MFELAVCSVQFSVHPVPLGHIIEIHTRIKDALMFGDTSLVRLTFRLATHFKRLLTLNQDLHKCEIPRILTHPLSSHVWRTGPTCSLKTHHRCHSVIFDQCAFGTPWKLRTKLIAGHSDYQDILPLAEYSCNKHHVCFQSPSSHPTAWRRSQWTTVYSTLQSSLTRPLLQAVQYYHFQGNWKQMTPSTLLI